MIDQTVFSLNIWDVYQKEGKEAFDKGDLDEAELDFQSALEKAERFGANDLRIATSKRHLAEVKHKKGDTDAAKQLFQEALELLGNELGQESLSLVKTLMAYKSLLDELGDEQAQVIGKRLRDIRSHAVSVGNTTDLFTVEIPANPETQPMTPQQDARIRELLTQEGVPDELVAEIRAQIDKPQTFAWAHDIQGRIRKAIVQHHSPEQP